MYRNSARGPIYRGPSIPRRAFATRNGFNNRRTVYYPQPGRQFVRRRLVSVAARNRRQVNSRIRVLQRNTAVIPQRVTSGAKITQRQRKHDEILLTKCEQAAEILPGVNTINFVPGSSGCLVLDEIAGIFDTYRIEQARAEFRPNLSTTVSGRVTVGIDYNPDTPFTNQQEISALTGSTSDTIFKEVTVPVSIDKAQKQKWLSTASSTASYSKQAFAVGVYCNPPADSPPVGTLWISYSIRFSSINAVSLVDRAATKTATSLNRSIPAVTRPNITTESVITDATAPDSVKISPNVVINPDDRTAFGVQTEELPVESFHKVGDEITIASLIPTDPSLLLAAPTGKVNFFYSDKTPVETGAIQQYPISASQNLYASGYGVIPADSSATFTFNQDLQTGLLAGLFKVVSPLLKSLPIVGEVLNVLNPADASLDEIPGSTILSTADGYRVGFDPETYGESLPIVNSIALGNEISAEIPQSNSFNSVEYVPSNFSYVVFYPNLSAAFTYEVNSSPFTITPHLIAVPGDPSKFYPDYITITTPDGVDAFRSGDTFNFSSYSVIVPVSGSTTIAWAVAGSDITNIDFVDSQGETNVGYGRVVTLIRDNEGVTIKLPPLPAEVVLGSYFFNVSFSRISRADTKLAITPDPVQARSRLRLKA